MISYKKLLYDTDTPISLTDKLTSFFDKELVFLFESGINNENGNFSFVFVGARERIWHKDGKSFYKNEDGNTEEVDTNPLDFLKKRFKKEEKNLYKKYAEELGVGLVDGFVGFVGYDMVKVFNPSIASSMQDLKDGTKTADLDLIRPKYLFVFSHKNQTLTALSTMPSSMESIDRVVDFLLNSTQKRAIKSAKKLADGYFAFDKKRFFEILDSSKEAIARDEISQIVISNRFTQPACVDPFSFYRVLRSKNPSPYQFYLPFEEFAIAGSSPEVMIKLDGDKILLRPIAGTRKRGKTRERDLELEAELLADHKEIVEHEMLIDLGINDLQKVAKPDTIEIQNRMHIERFSHVMHIVSDLVATLDESKDMFDLFAATFCAGTVSGAPKMRAMELIAELEGVKRGFYSGAVVHFGFGGDMDSAITIRSSLIKENEIIFQAGAGVVADSQNELEFLEISNKIAATVASFEELLTI